MNDPLQKVFSEYRPEMGDREKYMAELEKKLVVARYFKRERRRLRLTAIAMTIAGAIVGGVATAFFLTNPVEIPQLNFMDWLSANFSMTLAITAGCAILGYLAACYMENEEVF